MQSVELGFKPCQSPLNFTHRHYRDVDIDRIESILKLKSFGFSLAKISSILANPSDGPFSLSVSQCAEQIAFLEDQLLIVNNAIAELEKACAPESPAMLRPSEASFASIRGRLRGRRPN